MIILQNINIIFMKINKIKYANFINLNLLIYNKIIEFYFILF